jgi:hypothetical protein
MGLISEKSVRGFAFESKIGIIKSVKAAKKSKDGSSLRTLPLLPESTRLNNIGFRREGTFLSWERDYRIKGQLQREA